MTETPEGVQFFPLDTHVDHRGELTVLFNRLWRMGLQHFKRGDQRAGRDRAFRHAGGDGRLGVGNPCPDCFACAGAAKIPATIDGLERMAG